MFEGVTPIPKTKVIMDAIHDAANAIITAIEAGSITDTTTEILENSIMTMMDEMTLHVNDFNDFSSIEKRMIFMFIKKTVVESILSATGFIIHEIEKDKILNKNRDILIKMMRDGVATDDKSDFIMAGAENMMPSFSTDTDISKYTTDVKVIKAFKEFIIRIKKITKIKEFLDNKKR